MRNSHVRTLFFLIGFSIQLKHKKNFSVRQSRLIFIIIAYLHLKKLRSQTFSAAKNSFEDTTYVYFHTEPLLLIETMCDKNSL